MRAAILLIAFLSAEVSAFGTVHHCEPHDAMVYDGFMTVNCDTAMRCLRGYWSAGDVMGAAWYQLSSIDHMPQFKSFEGATGYVSTAPSHAKNDRPPARKCLLAASSRLTRPK